MHKITNAKYIKDHILELEFDNSEVKIINIRPYINNGISFIPLKEKEIFKMFRIKGNTITWIT